eukprot:m51a1_g10195 putative adenylate guanylate cyclase catalytic domain protein (765) ;mRNA; f:27168-29521
MGKRMHFSAGTTTAAINLVTSVVLIGVVIAIFATLSTAFSLSLIEKNINMQLDLQVSTVRKVDSRTVDIGGHFQTLFQAKVLPARFDLDTATPFYWGYKALQSYLTWVAYYHPDDYGKFIAVMYSKADNGICAANGMGTINSKTTEAQIMRYWVREGAGDNVSYQWFRNYTGLISGYLAGQYDAPVAHLVNPSGATGELVITYSMRLCADGNTCEPSAPNQAGILQTWTSAGDLSTNLAASMSDGADPKARSFVTDSTGRLVATSHGQAWVMVNKKMYYLMMDNATAGDHTLTKIGHDLLRAGVAGQEITMHRTGSHIVSSRAVAIGRAGTVWTVYYAIPTEVAVGELNKTVGICAGIAAALALMAAVVSWVVQHVFLTKPLSHAVSTINTLARLNMHGIAEATLSLSARDYEVGPKVTKVSSDELAKLSRSRSSSSSALMGNFLNEVSGVLQAADKMVHSLYCVGRYVSMDLATWVIGKGVVSSPLQPRDVSVLFCDIEGSTAMIDRCRAEGTMSEFAELLNEILTGLANTAKQYGGYIDKFIGDEVMVVFNAPCECSNHQSRACQAAVGMQACVQKLKATWEREHKYESFKCPRVRVSIASGTVLVGDIGAFGTLVNYTAIGETVCIAARLQEVAKTIRPPTGILVTGETWDAAATAGDVSLVTDESHTTSIVGHSCGTTMVRGCTLPLALYVLLGNRESLPVDVATSSIHLQRAMAALSNGERETCSRELTLVDDSYLPIVRAATVTAIQSLSTTIDLTKK